MKAVSTCSAPGVTRLFVPASPPFSRDIEQEPCRLSDRVEGGPPFSVPPAKDRGHGAAVGAAVGAVVGAVGGHVAAEALDPTVETDYWRQNYKTRPYYKQGKAFGAYEAAYRYGWENAVVKKDLTFAGLAGRMPRAPQAGWSSVELF